jgi:chromosome partitioning protein
VKAAGDRYDSVVIDTGNDASAIRAGLEVTDHLVVPIAPTGTESTRLRPTLEAAAEVAQRRHIELSLLLTRVRRTRSKTESRAALEGHMGLRVLQAEVPLLERFAAAYGTRPADLSPYDQVIDELHKIEEGRE